MTYVGIQYVNAQENIRHNRVSEAETERHNRMTEDVSIATLGETYRHNVVSENISQQDADTRRRAQELSEREYVEVTKPKASAQISLWNAQTKESVAKAGLVQAQTLTEAYKQQYNYASMVAQGALAKKYAVEADLTASKKIQQDAESSISIAKAQTAIKYYDVENNYIVQTVRSALDTLGSLVHASVKY